MPPLDGRTVKFSDREIPVIRTKELTPAVPFGCVKTKDPDGDVVVNVTVASVHVD